MHEAVAADFLPKVLAELSGAGVVLHTDDASGAAAEAAGVPHQAATEQDYGTEYLALEMSVRVVPDLDAALEHIRTYSSGTPRRSSPRTARRPGGSPTRSTPPP